MGHPVYESMAAFLADVSRKLHHHHREKSVDGGGNKLSPPSPARRVIGKARAMVVFLYIAAKKKCTAPKEGRQTMPTDEDQIGDGKSSSSSSPVRRALGKARAVVVLAFLTAKKKLDVRANDGEEGMKEAPEVDDGSYSVCGSNKRCPPTSSTPVRRALRKTWAVVVSPFHAAKKKADRKEHSEHVEEEMAAAGESMSVCSGGELSPSRRNNPLGSVRAIVFHPFLHASKKKQGTEAENKETVIPSEAAPEEAEHEFATSPSSLYSTSSLLGTKTSKATPTRSPKALLRKVRAATVLLPFPSRKKPSEHSASLEEENKDLPPPEEGASLEGVVWKKTILLGQKCEPLDFPGVIYYDSRGERLDGVPPRSPMSAVQQQIGNSVEEQREQHVQKNGFSFPVPVPEPRIMDGELGTHG